MFDQPPSSKVTRSGFFREEESENPSHPLPLELQFIDSGPGTYHCPHDPANRSSYQLSPIQDCPGDVLLIIFEEHISSVLDPFFASLKLSHVCQNWRIITLASPLLWRKVDFKRTMRPQVMKEVAEAFATRVKHAPGDITVEIFLDMPSRSYTKCAVAAIPFDIIYSIPSIESLIIGIHTNSIKEPALLNAIHQIPTSVGRLTLILNLDRTRTITRLIARLPPLHALKLGKGTIEVQDATLLSTVMADLAVLNIDSATHVPLYTLLKLTPALLRLTVIHSSFLTERHRNVCILPHLQYLRVDNGSFPWDRIQCPALIHFHFPTDIPKRDYDPMFSLLQASSMITDVHTDGISFHQLIRLSIAVPQLEHLRMHDEFGSVRVLTGIALKEPLFPNLRSLVLLDAGNGKLTSGFDQFLYNRCLPWDHPKCTMDPRIKHRIKECSIHIYPRNIDRKTALLFEEYFELWKSEILSEGVEYRLTGKVVGRSGI